MPCASVFVPDGSSPRREMARRFTPPLCPAAMPSVTPMVTRRQASPRCRAPDLMSDVIASPTGITRCRRQAFHAPQPFHALRVISRCLFMPLFQAFTLSAMIIRAAPTPSRCRRAARCLRLKLPAGEKGQPQMPASAPAPHVVRVRCAIHIASHLSAVERPLSGEPATALISRLR